MRKAEVISIVLMSLCLLTAGTLCASEAGNDAAAIRKLLLTLERGYEGKDVESYISVFSDKEYEYVSDVTTPDDPSDDIHLSGVESERRAAVRVFRIYENLVLDMTEPDIVINGSSAEAKSNFTVVFVVFESSCIPSIYYAGGTNVFSLRKAKNEWRIVRWQQHEMAVDDLAAIMKAEQKDKKVEELLRDLESDHLRTWAIAVSDLRKMRGMAVASLIKALHSKDKKVRIRVASVLCGTRNEGAVRELVKILEDEKDDVDVRVAAANALGECNSQMAANSLFTTAKGKVYRLKAAASLALARRLRKKMDDLYWIVAAGLRHEDEAVREASTESIGIMMSTSGTSLMEQRFIDKNESEDVRLAAWEALKKLDSESVLRLFRNALKDKTEAVQIRIHAVRALAKAKDIEALKTLIDLAENKKETFELRKEAIIALGTLDDSKATKPLIQILNSADAGLRREAASSLERIGDRRALKPLVIVLMNRDEDIYVRRLAGRGVVKIDRDIAFGPLVQIIKDEAESPPARRMAAERLALFRDDRSTAQLIEVLKDKRQPWWLRQIAANNLGMADPTSPCIKALKIAANDADERISKIAQDALKRIDAKLSANS